MDEIKVNCKAADTLDLQDMTLYQGELKSRTDADYEHIKKSILEYGFCAPFFIWEHDGINSVLDGTGRYETLKPVELVENAILNSSQSNDIIADLFGGSGTTLIACGKTGRRCRIMELDPHYCDVIRRRWTKWARANGKEAGTGALD